jgi:hypothetical protein
VATNGAASMIDVYATEVQAVDSCNKLLFTLKMVDNNCCTMSITSDLILCNSELEELLDAVRRGVKMLNLD